MAEIVVEFGLEPPEYPPIVISLRKNPKAWLEFMMKYLHFCLLRLQSFFIISFIYVFLF